MTDGQNKALSELADLINQLGDELERCEEAIHSAVFQLRHLATKHLLQVHMEEVQPGCKVKHVCQTTKEDAHDLRMAEIENEIMKELH